MLTADQIHILANASKASEMVAASKLYSKSHIKARDVRELFSLGYLNSDGKRYGPNKKTFKALEEAGFTELSSQLPVQKKSPDIEEFAGKLRQSEKVTVDRKRITAGVLELVRRKARGGDPWDWIRLQWPELIIKDSTDLAYFKKHCERTEALDLRIDDRQYDLIKHALAPRRVKEIGIKGSTSPGKGLATALLINIWYDIYNQDRIIIIGPTSAHAKGVMFGEVSKWRRKMRLKRETEILQTEGIRDLENEKHAIIISNPDAAESVSGLHGLNTLYVLDESSSIPDDIYVSCQKPARLIIAISNPRILSGWFRSWFPGSDPDKNQIIVDRGVRRSLLTFGGPDCLNVKASRLNEYEYSPPGGIEIKELNGKHHLIPEGELIPKELYPHVKALIPGQMDAAKYRSIMQGRDEIVKCWSGEGKFPPEDLEFQICPPSWLKEPNREWEENHEQINVVAFGLDVAYSLDNDATVLTSGGTRGVRGIAKTHKANAIETAHWVVNSAQQSHGIDLKRGGHPVAVDCVGVGGPVADILEGMGVLVIRVFANKVAENARIYMNTRAEMYGEFGERLDPEGQHQEVFMLPPDPDLEQELAAHEKEYDRDMLRFGITPKKRERGTRTTRQSIQERIGRSPDTSDSVALCYIAIRQTDENSMIGNQFKPTEVISRYFELRDGRILVTLASGKELLVTKEEFEERWGTAPPTVEASVNAYMDLMTRRR